MLLFFLGVYILWSTGIVSWPYWVVWSVEKGDKELGVMICLFVVHI